MIYPSPPCVNWHITHKCNLSCRHCYSRTDNSSIELGKEQVRYVVERLAEAGTLMVHFGGGEPFMRQDLVWITALLRERNIAVAASTNGLLIDRQQITAFKQAGLSSVYISIDSVDETVHDRIRGYEGAHRTAAKCAKELVESGIEVTLCTVISRQNCAELDALKAFAESLGISRMNAKIFRPAGNGLKNSDQFSMNKAENERFHNWVKNVNRAGHFDIKTVSCPCKLKGFFILPNGDVPNCCYVPEVAGNILKEGVRPIWKRLLDRRCSYSLVSQHATEI